MSEVQRDLVLNPNEYAYVLDKTKGLISCVVGSYKMSLSTSDALVVFDEVTKRFKESNINDAIQTFVSAPDNWYVVLKNPTEDNKYPSLGTASQLPSLKIGKKINIRGNISFPLYPGQMAKVIKGHTLRSNQYLVVRVYDDEAIEDDNSRIEVGQISIIKGTETSFYIPETGYEVIPDENGNYVRDAVTLEQLEYCILKNEKGEKKYVNGAAVVFPDPDETFIINKNDGTYKFKAIELSEISGVYVKVISDYTDEKGVEHKTGEELFITGKDQMIYYPRKEHAIIDYDGKIMYHAIAIPLGEGRYVLNRKTGEIKTVKGASMYLPDPRNEVIVRRRLTEKQCKLWYPNNNDVLKHNGYNMNSASTDDLLSISSLNCNVNTRGISFDKGFSRGNTYTAPRTIEIDNKYDGVVSLDIWTGYAVNVISKDGSRKVLSGAQTYLLNYDETLEVLTNDSSQTVFLRTDNNKISDVVYVQTKDFVDVKIEVSYCVDFLEKYKDKWFSIEDYIKYLCDRVRSLLKAEAKKYTIEKFYNNAENIVKNVVLNDDEYVYDAEDEQTLFSGRLFEENGMFIKDVEVLKTDICGDINDVIFDHQELMVKKTLELSNAVKDLELTKQLNDINKQKTLINDENRKIILDLDSSYNKEKLEKQEELNRFKEESELARKNAEKEIQSVIDVIEAARMQRKKNASDEYLRVAKANDDLSIAKQQAQADTIKKVMNAISPDLIASMTSQSNAELLTVVSESMSPYAIAQGQPVSDVVNKLLRGTSLEGIIDKVVDTQSK